MQHFPSKKIEVEIQHIFREFSILSIAIWFYLCAIHIQLYIENDAIKTRFQKMIGKRVILCIWCISSE